MSKEVRRFKITGKLLELVDANLEERRLFFDEAKKLCQKYKFESFFHTTADFASGSKFSAFTDPLEGVDLKAFRRPSKQKAYVPKVKEGKHIIEDIKKLKVWSLKTIWDYLDYSPHPFGGNGGYYKDEKINDELLFFSYDTEFKGHSDLQELKKSEYFALIGE